MGVFDERGIPVISPVKKKRESDEQAVGGGQRCGAFGSPILLGKRLKIESFPEGEIRDFQGEKFEAKSKT